MKLPAALVRATAIVVFLQIALGGLLVFGFIEPLPHIITGFGVLAFAIATLAVAATSKPRMRQLMGLSIGLVLATVVQILLGFYALATSNNVIVWVHLLLATGIYGMSVAGNFIAMRDEYMSRAQVPATH